MYMCWYSHPLVLIIARSHVHADHCAIFLCIACSFSPLSILLFSTKIICILAPIVLLTWICAAYGMWHAFTKNDGIINICFLNIVVMAPSFPFVAIFMTNYEKILGMLAIVFISCGAIVFGTQVINPLPSIFGYHEVNCRCIEINIRFIAKK
jgi:predicted membrane channel-forming protein YqfA (hemolysin III family)